MIAGGFDGIIRVGRNWDDNPAVKQERMDESDSTAVKSRFDGFYPSVSAQVDDETGEVLGDYQIENNGNGKNKSLNKVSFELWETGEVSIIEAEGFYHITAHRQDRKMDATTMNMKNRKTGKMEMTPLAERTVTTYRIRTIEQVDKPEWYASEERVQATSGLAKAKLGEIPLRKSWEERQAEEAEAEEEASTESK
jgi:hypothetical protein